MTRDEYKHEFRRLRNSRNLRKNSRLPRDVFEFGWEIAKTKPQSWIVARILFWLYAYDRDHKWTERDFTYEINDRAYELAKAKRRERRGSKKECAIKKRNQVRPFPNMRQTHWDECAEPPKHLLDQFYKNLEKTNPEDK